MAVSLHVGKILCNRSFGSLTRNVFGGSLLSRSGQLTSTSLIPKKTIYVTSVAKKRIYGPEDPHERVDEVQHWVNERYVAVALIPMIPISLAFPNMVFDIGLCTLMLLHVHWRLQGVIQDYIHFKPLYTVLKYAIWAFSIITLGSLTYFNYADVGFCRAARMIYTQL